MAGHSIWYLWMFKCHIAMGMKVSLSHNSVSLSLSPPPLFFQSYSNCCSATRLIRKHPNPEIRNILIIAMTASAIQGDREKCLESGMNNYLAKPVRAQTLKALLESYLNKEDDGNEIPNIQAEAKKLVKQALNEAEKKESETKENNGLSGELKEHDKLKKGDEEGKIRSRPPSVRMNTTQRIPQQETNGEKQ